MVQGRQRLERPEEAEVRFLKLAAAALIVVAAGCSTTVSGKITDVNTQHPVGDAQIWLQVKNARIKYLGTSAKNGAYTVVLPDYALDEPGVVQFQRAGYQTTILPPKNLPVHPN